MSQLRDRRQCAGTWAGCLLIGASSEIARGLQRGDAVITQSLGYSIELNLTAAGSPEHEGAAQGRKELRWLMRSQAPTTFSQAAEFRELQATLEREEDVARAVLRRHGKPAQPPPAWDPGG